MSGYAVCARTRRSRAMMRLSPLYEELDTVRDELQRQRQYLAPDKMRNYDLVLAEQVGGKWREIDCDVEGPLTPEEIALIEREEAAWQHSHRKVRRGL